MRVWPIVAAIAVIGGGSAAYFGYFHRVEAATGVSAYRVAAVQRTDLLATINATGTIVPEEVVDIGAQVNGQIASFGMDVEGRPVDYGSEVTEGMTLARIDDSLFVADLQTAESLLTQAQAQVRSAQAGLVQSRAQLDQATRDYERAQRLGQTSALSRADFDAAQSAFEQARAGVQVAEAQVGQTQAAVSVAEAAVTRARRNLGFTTISAPVDGVVIDRRVQIGQTVVSSLNAPSLFLIAKDLRRMQVLVQVNEADIKSVTPGQAVRFRVDAIPDRVFDGEVARVRLNATMTQNVVTYTVEITAENAAMELLPYLTAHVQFVVADRRDVLAVPTASLRWTPPEDAAVSRGGGGNPARRGGEGRGGAGRGGGGEGGGGGGGGGEQTGTVWVVEGGERLRPVSVAVGISDGALTEVRSTELSEGAQVVIGGALAGGAPGGAGTNPFAPTFPRRGGGGGGGGRR